MSNTILFFQKYVFLNFDLSAWWLAALNFIDMFHFRYVLLTMEKSQEQIDFTSIGTFYCKRMEKSKEQIQDFTTVVTLTLLETTVLPCWEKSISLPPLNFLVQWQRTYGVYVEELIIW